jgi:hypothetical protein
MKYTIEKLIHLLNVALKNESLLDDDTFDMIDSLIPEGPQTIH